MVFNNIVFKIALPVVLTGIFVIVIFMALNPDELDLSFYIVIILVCIFVFFYGVLSGQKTATPVKKLLKRALELSGGDLTARVYLESKDEFEELARLFNKIAEELEKSRAEAVTTEKSIGLKVKAQTQEMEETINALEQKVKNRTIELERLNGDSEKFRQEIKNKEAESLQLKEEIEALRQKSGRSERPRKKNNALPAQEI